MSRSTKVRRSRSRGRSRRRPSTRRVATTGVPQASPLEASRRGRRHPRVFCERSQRHIASSGAEVSCASHVLHRNGHAGHEHPGTMLISRSTTDGCWRGRSTDHDAHPGQQHATVITSESGHLTCAIATARTPHRMPVTEVLLVAWHRELESNDAKSCKGQVDGFEGFANVDKRR